MHSTTVSVCSNPRRLGALESLDIWGSPPEETFDRLTRLAAHLLNVPLALVNLVGADRQFSKSLVAPPGWPEGREATYSESICRHVVAAEDVVPITDARADDRASSLGIVREQGVRSYLGAPLVDHGGNTLGALCVLDFEVREWTPAQVEVLTELAGAVTAVMELRREARRRDTYFSALIENAKDVVGVLEPDGVIRYLSPAVEREYDVMPGQLIGRNAFELVHRDDADAVTAAWRATHAAPDGSARVECRLRQMNGDWRLHEVIIQNLVANDAVHGMVCNLRDISARRRAEEQLRQTLDRLRQSEKMDAVGRLAAGIAHDFNNLLTIITAYAGILRSDLGGDSPLAKDVDEIVTASNRAAALIRQLMAFSRQQVLRVEPVDLTRLVEGALQMLRRLIGEDLEITLDLAPELWQVEADRSQMEQILINLVVNARDAMPAGGTIAIVTRNVDLSEAYAERHQEVTPGPHVMLAVSDTGIGMDEETQFRIFEPFFTTKGVGEGTGLGLATVHGIVKQLGGHIWLYSEPGAGTTFRVYLPQLGEGAPAGDAEEAPPPAPATAQPHETVLLVEDDDAVRALTARLLKRLGYRVLSAASGPEALELARREPARIDLLLTDMVMPNMTGRALSEQLRRVRPAVRVLVMSGYTADEMDRRGLRGVGDRLLDKPFTHEELAVAVREVLGDGRSVDTDGAGRDRPRIAVVDDDPNNRELLQALLAGRYDVIEYATGAEAAAALAAAPPRLVLLDVAMPGMTGPDLLARIRGDVRTRHLPVVAVTARAMAGDRARLLALGFDDYLSKPIVDEQLLYDCIEKHLAGSSTEQQR